MSGFPEQRQTFLFANAEPPENLSQQIIWRAGPGDFTQCIVGQAQFFGQQIQRRDGASDERLRFVEMCAATSQCQQMPRARHVQSLGLRPPARKIEEFAYEPAPERVRRVLGVDQVLRVKRVNLADGEPFAVVTVWCPAELGAHLSRKDVERRPFYELLDVTLRGATQTIGADLVDAADARLLGVPPGSPVLRCQRVTTDADGRAVLMSEHLFPAHRTEFVVDLPQAEPSMTPSGMRIVD